MRSPPDPDAPDGATSRDPPDHAVLGAGMAIRGGAARVVGYGAGVLVSLATATLLVRHLGVPGFGRYVTVTSLVALVGGVTEAGIVVYGIREFTARDPSSRARLLANLLGLRLVLGVAGIALAVAFAAVAGYRSALVLGTLVAGAGLLAQIVADVLSVALQARLLLGRLTLIELARRALALALVAALAIAGAGLVPLFAAGSVAAAAAALATAYAVRGLAVPRPRFDVSQWRALFAETLPYAIALSLAAIYFYVTVILMSVIANAVQTGLFATSFRVVQAVLTVPALLLTAIFPLMSRASDDQLGDTVGKIFRVAVLLGVWMSLATALGAEFVVEAVAGRHGHGVAPVLRIQGLIFAASFVSTSSALGLVALRRYTALIIVTAASLAIDLVAGLALIPPLGAEGGAIADVGTEAIAAVALTASLVRSLPRHGIDGSVLVPLASALFLCGGAALLPIGSLGRALVATLVYFAVLVRMRALPEELFAALRRVRLRRA